MSISGLRVGRRLGRAPRPGIGGEQAVRLLRRVRRVQDRLCSVEIRVDPFAQLASPLHLRIQIGDHLLSVPALLTELLLQLLDAVADLAQLLGVALQGLDVLQADRCGRALWSVWRLAGSTAMK